MNATSHTPEKPVILVVDDEQFMRELFSATLREAGFSVETVAGGEEALSFFAHTRPDLVLLDLLMPGMDGLATCAALRHLPDAAFVPVIMVTAQDDHEAIRAALDAGVNDFMNKPIRPELLVHRIRYALHSSRTLQRLAENRSRLTDAQRIARLGNWEWRVLSNRLWWSEEITRILTPLPADFDDTSEAFFALIHPADRTFVTTAFRRCLDERIVIDVDCRLVRADNSLRFVHIRGEVADAHLGRTERIVGIMQDITARRRAEDKLQVLMEAVECLPIGITISDEAGQILYANTAEAEMHGRSVEELLQSKARDLAPERMEKALAPEQLPTLKLWQRESINQRKDGSEFPVQLFSMPVHNKQGEFLGLVTTCEDISTRKQAEERIAQLAYFDPLTGLPNRLMFRDRLNHGVDVARRDGRKLALLFLDLDRFKFINDTMGHDFGDQLLIAVARRLEESMRRADTVARLGGDEFVVILAAVDDQNGVAIAAKRILDLFSRPFELPERTVFTTPSIGIAIFPDDGLTADDLLKNADAAMYQAKSCGGQNYRFFSHEINRKILEKMALETQLRRALEMEEFILHYQPQYDLVSGCMVGVEALVRWQHPEHGLVMPGLFISTLEESGLILQLGEWVMRTACIQAKVWRESCFPELRMGINISACQFRQAGFLDLVDTIVAETGVEASWLEFELTESMIMDDPVKSRLLLNQIKERGIALAIDDFGTGYSSLSYLKNFPLDRIKIDRSFLAEVVQSRDDAAIVAAIITMAATLNLRVMAEGVETREQLDFLIDRGCHETQGYFFSRPISADALTALIVADFITPPGASITP